jgi:hypothetical protein
MSGLLVHTLAELLIKDSLTPGFWVRGQVVKGPAEILVVERASGWARNVTYGLLLNTLRRPATLLLVSEKGF